MPSLLPFAFIAALVLLAVFWFVHLRPSLELGRVARWSEQIVEESINDGGEIRRPRPPSMPPSSPMMAVDMTLSMAGFVFRDAEHFRILQAVSSALGSPEVFSYGNTPDSSAEAELDGLLRPHAGLDASFTERSSYQGGFNRDARLFEAMRDEVRPLVLVTDGVYSSPDGNGVEKVVAALDALIEEGWHLGVFLFEAPFACRGRDDECFYSEAGRRKHHLPCDTLHRPLYVLSLFPSPHSVRDLDRRFARSVEDGLAYLGAFQIGPGFDALIAEPPVVVTDRRGDFASEQWLMFFRSLETPLRLTGQVRLAPYAPVEALAWRPVLEYRPWKGSGWTQVNGELGSVVSSATARTLSVSETDLWRRLDRTIGEVRNWAFGNQGPATDSADDSEVVAVIDGLRSWARRSHGSDLLCALVNGPGNDVVLRRDVDSFRTLYALWAEDEGRLDTAERLVAGVLQEPFRKAFETLRSPSRRIEGSVEPVPVPETVPSASPDQPIQPQQSFIYDLEPGLLDEADGFALYRLRFVPVSARLSARLRARSTDDDNDPAEVLRTYRLADWITMLMTRRMARIAEDPRLQFFITHPGSP